MEVKFPEVQVQLSGHDGNAFMIMGKVTLAMCEAGVPTEDIERYSVDAMSGNYDNLLQVTMETVDVL